MLLSLRLASSGATALNFAVKRMFSQMKKKETIYALSSGINTAISIVRISGPDSFNVLKLAANTHEINSSKANLLSHFKVIPRQMMLRSIFNSDRGLIDKCLMVHFEAEKSYTGEDLFELHLHGSKAIVSAVFRELAKMDFKPAKRGEFTRRAMLNGRMSLLQAEAINDLIHSELEFQRQIAINNLMGKGSKYLESLKKELIGIKSLIQSYIQFEEQEVGLGVYEKAKQKSKIILEGLLKVIQSSQHLQKVKDGVKISIIGRPNVGKSTLINSLVQKDVAIVSQIPGTTRDLIESSFELRGYRVDIVDTAGVRQSDCQIEIQGIRRSKIAMQSSHLVLVLIDITQSSVHSTEELIVISPHQTELEMLQRENKLIVINKIDLLAKDITHKKIVIKLENGDFVEPQLCISAKNQKQIFKVTEIIGTVLQKTYNLYEQNGSELYFTRDRYIRALQACSHHLQQFLLEPYADLGSHFIDSAIRDVQEIVGKVDSEQILDQIFSTFCIGK